MAGGNLKEETTAGDLLVLTLNDDRARNPSLVGRKAANLAEIFSLPGIQVPPAFVVTTAAYRLFLSGHPELARMIVKLDDLTDEDRIRDTLEKIQQTIRTASIPHAVGEAIRHALRILSSWFRPDEVRVSVRSSATSEDSKAPLSQVSTRLG